MEWIQGWAEWFGYILRESWEFPALPGWAWVILLITGFQILIRSHSRNHIHDDVRGKVLDR